MIWVSGYLMIQFKTHQHLGGILVTYGNRVRVKFPLFKWLSLRLTVRAQIKGFVPHWIRLRLHSVPTLKSTRKGWRNKQSWMLLIVYSTVQKSWFSPPLLSLNLAFKKPHFLVIFLQAAFSLILTLIPVPDTFQIFNTDLWITGFDKYRTLFLYNRWTRKSDRPYLEVMSLRNRKQIQ